MQNNPKPITAKIPAIHQNIPAGGGRVDYSGRTGFKPKPVWIAGLILIFSLALILSACSSNNNSADNADITPTPTLAIVTKDNYSLEADRTCDLVDLIPIHSDKPQGTMIAWAPDGHHLAYVAPADRFWGWYEGDLVIYDVDGRKELQSTRDVRVAGDITWSPDGTKIAFIALHSPENRYTVEIYNLSDGSLTDLYPDLPATDSFASLKGIDDWTSNTTLDVSETCGIDCVDVVEHDLTTGQEQKIKEIRGDEDTSLKVITNQQFATSDLQWLLANWSPDINWVVFADSKDVVWMAQPKQQVKFPIDIQNDEMQESAWSPDSQYVAVRGLEHIFVFSVNCKK